MRILALVVLLLASQGSWAERLTERSSWAQILRSRTYSVMAPMELNPTGGLFNTCHDSEAGVFRSIQNVRFCARGGMVRIDQHDGGPTYEWRCQRYELAPVSMPIRSTRRECVDYVSNDSGSYCRGFQDVEIELPTEFLVDILDANAGSSFEVAFRKRFILPACQKESAE